MAETTLAPEHLNALRQRALSSLYFFARGVLGFDYMVPHVHGRVCEFLERPARRKRVTLPRGFLKTTLCSVAYPLWRAVRDPNIRILIAMKTLPNAQKTIGQIRTIVDRNTLFRTLFPELLPTRDDPWSNDSACLQRPGFFRESTFEAAGIGTNVTSRHYDLIIEDDLVAPTKDDMTGLEAMPTREEIEKAIGWHKLARSLLVSLEHGEIMNVGTRWSKYDLIQYIIDNEPNTEHFELAALDEQGEPTYPERFPKDVLAEIELEQGTYIFSSQYLNKPYDEARMVFKDEWLQNHWEEGSLPEDIKKAIVVDPAISESKDACNSVVVCLGAHEHRLYVLDYHVGKFDPSTLIDRMIDLALKWDVRDIFPEAVAWQQALVHFFEVTCRERGLWFNVEGIKPGNAESKDMRIRSLQPFAQRGALLLRPWMRELKKELRDFPFSKTVDIADAVAYGPRVLGIEFARVKPAPKTPPHGETVGDVIEALHKKGRQPRWGLSRRVLDLVGL